MKKTERRSERMKAEIIATAGRLFREHGYEDTTFQLIADELRISKGSISYHYKSKPWLVYSFFYRYMRAVQEYIRIHLTDNFNDYLYWCISHLRFYREIMIDESTRTLFYQEDHVSIWERESIGLVEEYFRAITNDYHKNLLEEEIHVAAVMCIGAKKNMFKEVTLYSKSIDVDLYCRHIVYMVGLLARLDENTIKTNIQRAYDFLNKHDFPNIPLYERIT